MIRKLIALLAAALLTASLLMAAPAMAEYATLQNGDTGQAVVALQVALNQLGYNTGGTDGKYGTSTENAVRKFQGRNGLKVDGKAGDKTQTLIYQKAGSIQPSAATPAPAVTAQTGYFGGQYATLSFGSSGSRVTLLQKALIALGYGPAKADGRFGTSTQTAVTAFQRAQKLTADGKAGKATLQRIETLLANGGGSAQPAAPTAAPTTVTVNGYTMPTRTLRRGYSGQDVKSVQQRLKDLGYFTGKIDSVYGSGTITAVKAFQKANGLTADGLAGAKTCQLIFAAGAIPASSASASAATPTPAATTAAYTTLRSGATGAAVTLLQQTLQALNYTVTVTGTYDSATQAAVKAFQKANKLTADGVAGPVTLAKLYSGTAAAQPAQTQAPAASTVTGTVASAPVGSVRLLHWFNDIKPGLSNGQTLLIQDPSSGRSWSLKVLSRGNHADCEPLTAADTAEMLAAFGGKNTWNQKGVYVRLPNGTWTIGSTHDMPHLSGSNNSNDFNGHLCVHFLRDMSECKKNDPNYGVSNQNTIRSMWKAITGETIE